MVASVRQHLPRVDAIHETSVQDGLQLRLEDVVGDGRAHLHATNKVAAHPVGAANVELGVALVVKAEDAVVFQETADDGHHAHVLGDARHARTQTADAAHNELDLDARGRSLVELLSQHSVVQAVHLGRHGCGQARLRVGNLGVDEVAELAPHRVRRNQQLAVRKLAVVAREVLEEVGDVSAQLLVAGEQPHVCVEAGSARVVVARSQVHVRAQAIVLLAHNQHGFAMSLQTNQAVRHVAASIFQLVGEAHVARLVETSLQLNQHSNLLAGLSRHGQRVDDWRVAAGAVQSSLDGHHGGVPRS